MNELTSTCAYDDPAPSTLPVPAAPRGDSLLSLPAFCISHLAAGERTIALTLAVGASADDDEVVCQAFLAPSGLQIRAGAPT